MEQPGDRVAQALEKHTQMLQRAGLLGDTAAGVGDKRMASPDPQAILQNGLAPMVWTVKQQDR